MEMHATDALLCLSLSARTLGHESTPAPLRGAAGMMAAESFPLAPQAPVSTDYLQRRGLKFGR